MAHTLSKMFKNKEEAEQKHQGFMEYFRQLNKSEVRHYSVLIDVLFDTIKNHRVIKRTPFLSELWLMDKELFFARDSLNPCNVLQDPGKTYRQHFCNGHFFANVPVKWTKRNTSVHRYFGVLNSLEIFELYVFLADQSNYFKDRMRGEWINVADRQGDLTITLSTRSVSLRVQGLVKATQKYIDSYPFWMQTEVKNGELAWK